MTSPPPPSNTVPAAPTAATATRSLSTVTVRWTDNASNETGFYVYRERYNTWTRRWESKTRISTLGANAPSYSGSMSTGTYRYFVVAYNSAGQSSAAVTGSVTR